MTRPRFAGYIVFEGTVSGESGDIAIDDISVRRGACGVRVKNDIKSHGNVSLYIICFSLDFFENKSLFFSSNISLVCSLTDEVSKRSDRDQGR